MREMEGQDSLTLDFLPGKLPILKEIEGGNGLRNGKGSIAIERIEEAPALMPGREPGSGEQYRFSFDMTACIGCKCCVVACSEQNNNPAGIFWRRVGEMEGGVYPNAKRHYLSMGCNHCLDPACLNGCPVEAYTKNEDNGLVLHSAETCIGCQYCTWNCPYGVPQFNPERKVVGKCDMCVGRLSDGDMPACVSACPQQAISVEIVNKEQWVAEALESANAPGSPSARITLSTTKIKLPEGMPAEMLRADSHILRPEAPHWPLVFLTSLTQVGFGMALAAAGAELAGASGMEIPAWPMAWLTLLALTATGFGMIASMLHLGRPIHAFRALAGWRRSWLSREAAGLTAYFLAMHALAAFAWLRVLPVGGSISWPLGLAAAATLAAGAAGIFCGAKIYRVPARPAWDSFYTIPHFFLGGAAVGLLGAAAVFAPAGGALPKAMAGGAILFGSADMILTLIFKLYLLNSDADELRRTGLLYTRRFRNLSASRLIVWFAGAMAMPAFEFVSGGPAALCAAAAVAAGAAFLIGRYLFFVTVAPKNIPGSFFMGANGAH